LIGLDAIAPHPLARLGFRSCRIPVDRRMATKRRLQDRDAHARACSAASVAAAALGTQRALDEALAHAKARHVRPAARDTAHASALADIASLEGHDC
jgi:acyl-CoA dehydrogenase